MSDYAKQIEARKVALKRMETARIQAESDKTHAEARLAELHAEVRAQGVEPENLDTEITRLEAEIQMGLMQVTELIPEQFHTARRG